MMSCVPMPSGSVVFTKMPIALMFAIDAKRNVSSAMQSTAHSTSNRSWLRRSSRLGMGSGSSAAATGAFGFLIVAIASLPPLLHLQRPAVDPVVPVVRTALDLESRIAREQAEVNLIRAGCEVRLELEVVVVHEQVSREPERHRVLAVHRLVIAVVPAVVPVDVDEGLPLGGHRRKHFVVGLQVVVLAGGDPVDQVALFVGQVDAD